MMSEPMTALEDTLAFQLDAAGLTGFVREYFKQLRKGAK